VGQMLLTFALAVVGWIIFRAENIGQVGEYVCGIFDSSLFTIPYLKNRLFYIPLLTSICILLLCEWINRHKNHGLALDIKQKWVRFLIYYFMILMCVFNMGQEQTFIYFQF
jgi:hypothetical protein